MRRRLLFLVCLCFVIGVPCATLRLQHPPPGPCPVDVRPETYEKLKLDMDEREVEAIFGGPAGDYRTRSDVYHGILHIGWEPDLSGYIKKEWLTDDFLIRVWFDADGKIRHTQWGAGTRPPSWIHQLLR